MTNILSYTDKYLELNGIPQATRQRIAELLADYEPSSLRTFNDLLDDFVILHGFEGESAIETFKANLIE